MSRLHVCYNHVRQQHPGNTCVQWSGEKCLVLVSVIITLLVPNYVPSEYIPSHYVLSAFEQRAKLLLFYYCKILQFFHLRVDEFSFVTAFDAHFDDEVILNRQCDSGAGRSLGWCVAGAFGGSIRKLK